MLSDSKISKGGIIGAISGLIASFFIHKPTETMGKKVIKSGTFSILGYILGSFVEKKIKQPKK